MAAAVGSCGHRTALASTMVRVGGCSSSERGAVTVPTALTQATMRRPKRSDSHFSAMAPAATRPMVSLALALPPPEAALTPYLAWYVKSACEGRGMSAMEA